MAAGRVKLGHLIKFGALSMAKLGVGSHLHAESFS